MSVGDLGAHRGGLLVVLPLHGDVARLLGMHRRGPVNQKREELDFLLFLVREYWKGVIVRTLSAMLFLLVADYRD